MILLTPPTAEPVTLAEVKTHLRLDADITDDDAMIGMMISAARQQAEHRTGRRYGLQSWRLVLDKFPAWGVRMPFPPLVSVVSLKYDDDDGVERILASGADFLMRAHAEPGTLFPVKAWPATFDGPGAVRIDITCGLTDSSPYWHSLKAWMLLAIGTWYEHREAASDGKLSELPHAFWSGLLDPLIYYGG